MFFEHADGFLAEDKYNKIVQINK